MKILLQKFKIKLLNFRFRKKAKIYYINTNMGLPWYRVHTVVLNDPVV
jgi:hypothetical protein